MRSAAVGSLHSWGPDPDVSAVRIRDGAADGPAVASIEFGLTAHPAVLDTTHMEKYCEPPP
jgi:hypothetical protein